jgi:hypothetical protein
MRVLKAAAATTAILGAGTAVALAQAPVPTVEVAVTTTAVTASAPVAPGATRFVFVSGEQRAAQGVFVTAVKRGYTADEAIAAVKANPDNAFEVVDIVASGGLAPGGRRAMTVEVEAGRSYWLVNDAGRENPNTWIFTPLAVEGAPTGATAPRPDAAITLRDNRFLGARTLPRNGTIRVRNVGWAPHIAIAFPLRRSARPAAVGTALRRNRERAMARLLDLPNTVEVASVLTRNAVVDQEIRFGKRGRYVLVCFVENHQRQGMYRFVRVR